jgi:hypothetical protein
MRNIVSLCAGVALCLVFAAQGVSAQTNTSPAPQMLKPSSPQTSRRSSRSSTCRAHPRRPPQRLR